MTFDFASFKQECTELSALLKKLDKLNKRDYWFNESDEERYSELRDSLLEQADPILELLINAELLTVVLDSPRFLKKKYKTVEFGVVQHNRNGCVFSLELEPFALAIVPNVSNIPNNKNADVSNRG
jgi:hypothetical protein